MFRFSSDFRRCHGHAERYAISLMLRRFSLSMSPPLFRHYFAFAALIIFR